ncbi:hypothetical protein Dda_5242 [Drechslerella dactyloides]|uniref:Alpha/beta hydrolase fold-3 domain-containing protein n=1 Tax=Drechslerella dactyloides TaxID=74499 RepID=A0AAD6IVU5_DREDA|nr:hypothetical protein Dda_5242 [Drechslerella dactyloides]
MASFAESSKPEPEFVQLLSMLPPVDTTNFGPQDYRAGLAALTEYPNSLYPGPKDADAADTKITVRDGTEVSVRVYTPHESVKTDKPPSILFHIHGGGWIGGTLEFGHPHCLWFASHNVVVVSVAYRVCPENPWNVPQEDCYDVYRAVHAADAAQLAAWGIPPFDRSKVFMHGLSAGGQIAAACVILDIEAGRTGTIAGLLLHATCAVDPALFPVDKITSAEGNSFVQNKDAPFVGTRDFERMVGWRNSPKEADRYFSPLVALPDEELKLFPPTYSISYGMDCLRDGQMLFAMRLKEVGVASTVDLYAGYGHCLFATGWMLEGSKRAMADLEKESKRLGVF